MPKTISNIENITAQRSHIQNQLNGNKYIQPKISLSFQLKSREQGIVIIIVAIFSFRGSAPKGLTSLVPLYNGYGIFSQQPKMNVNECKKSIRVKQSFPVTQSNHG